MTVIEIIALIIGVLVAFRVVQFIAARAVGMLKTDQELIDEEKLDGAPELTLDPDVIEFRDWTSISYEVNEARTMRRTVVKGDWERLPVEGESNNA